MSIQIPVPQSTPMLSRLLKSVRGEEALSDCHHHCRPIRVFPCTWSQLVKAQGFLLVVLVSVVRDPVVVKLTTLQHQI